MLSIEKLVFHIRIPTKTGMSSSKSILNQFILHRGVKFLFKNVCIGNVRGYKFI